MKDKIVQYLISENGVSATVAGILAGDILQHADIAEEFCSWLVTRKYPDNEAALEVNGYTAAAIHQIAPHLDPFGVYSFLVTLRDHPEKAKTFIQQNFMRK